MALLVRKVGAGHLERVEDAVQAALLAALTAWQGAGVPEDPRAWVYRAACNALLGELRREGDRHRILNRAVTELGAAVSAPVAPAFAGEVDDELLRMLFVACDEAIPRESRLVLALKVLCGFSTGEIALRLFTSEANVHKRLGRARQRLAETAFEAEAPPLEALRARLPDVHEVLYLLFNEGYLSLQAHAAIRIELCDEAIRLATLLGAHPVGARPDTFALLALMHLHASRLAARVDDTGGLLLLEEQDRSRWDRDRMQRGAECLARAASGATFSRYHAEAAIAAEHALTPSFAATRWSEIADGYAMLERIAPSPLHTLNRALAVAEWQGPAAGLALLDGLTPPAWLAGSYLWDAALADLHRRAGHDERALSHRTRALAAAPSEAVRRLLARRLGTDA